MTVQMGPYPVWFNRCLRPVRKLTQIVLDILLSMQLDDEEPFNQDYLDVERVLEESIEDGVSISIMLHCQESSFCPPTADCSLWRIAFTVVRYSL